MTERLRPAERYEQIRKSKRRVFWAFIVAPTVPYGLFFVFALIYGMTTSGASWQSLFDIQILILIAVSFPFGLIPIIAFTALTLGPVYMLLRNLNKLSAWTILPAAGLQGAALALVLLWLAPTLHGPETGPELAPNNLLMALLLFIICGLVGGIVFCRMTIWRKPEMDQATDGMR